MRIGLISDIHGNLPALETVLGALRDAKVDTMFCLGDTVGYGPYPNECLALVREHCTVVLKGNHDSGLIGETSVEDFNQYGLKALLWSQARVTEEYKEYLRGLPFLIVKEDVTLAHASPLRPGEWSYILTLRSARINFSSFSTTICFIGHTHVPVIINEDLSVGEFKKGSRCLINIGSVGQPRDGNPNAAYGIYDTESTEFVLYRMPYDIQKTADAIIAAGLPEYLARRLFQGA
jgi:diadenosine tetraphosphatase ApaH/serine/threonine PP2A family protein phosphatase